MKRYPATDDPQMRGGCSPEDSRARLLVAKRSGNSHDITGKGTLKAGRHEFWRSFCRKHGVTDEEKKWLQYQLRLGRVRERRRLQRAGGMTWRGNTAGGKGKLGMSNVTPNQLPNPRFAYIFPAYLGYIRRGTTQKAKAVQDRLIERLRGGAGCAHRSNANIGTNLGIRISPGGKYATGTRSGTCFMSTALSKRATAAPVFGEVVCPPEWEREGLHHEVLDMLSQVINDAFGTSPWYKKLMHDLSDIPKDRLLPGIPCSGAWFSSNPQPHNWHVDTNTVAAVFAFCLETVEGGEVRVMMPHQTIDVHLKQGVVLGGTWAQYPHCNQPIAAGAKRHSFVAYLDHRVLNNKYWTRQDFVTFNSTGKDAEDRTG